MQAGKEMWHEQHSDQISQDRRMQERRHPHRLQRRGVNQGPKSRWQVATARKRGKERSKGWGREHKTGDFCGR